MSIKASLASCVILFSAYRSESFPATVDIGTFTIDDYSSNGGGAGNLNHMIASGQNFFWAANANVPGYSAGAASNPRFFLDARDTQVSKAAITNTIGGSGNREYSDFIFYGGHGYNGSMFLGFNGSYGQVFPADLNLGVGYNRWFFTNSCTLFKGGSDPATHWQPAFKGLKAMLGFKSFVFDNHLSYDLYNNFWSGWTYGEKSLLMAFFDANVNYGYKHLYPTKGLEPGCLSAQVPAGGFDYCQESFKYVRHDYTPATANTGWYYSKIIGTPQY